MVNIHDPFQEAIIAFFRDGCLYPIPGLFGMLMPPSDVAVKTEYLQVISVKPEFGILAFGEDMTGV
jgi:hypothetical protein